MPRPSAGKRGSDGLTVRERAFVHERRADVTASDHVIMSRAGYTGSTVNLGKRAHLLMRKPLVAAAVRAPDRSIEALADDEDGLKREMRLHLLRIVRGQASDADKIKSIDKLLATIPGGYVPVQVDMKSRLTLENLLTGAGLSPNQPQLAAMSQSQEDA